MKLLKSLTTVATCSVAVSNAVPYSEYILAPASRTLFPEAVYKVNGTVTGAQSLIGGNGSAVFQGVSSVTFDYHKNIAGVVSVIVGNSSSSDAAIGLTYSESSLWITGQGSDATGDFGLDEVIWLPVGRGPGTYTVDRWHERGAFKYLSLINNSSALIEVESVSTYFTAAPIQDLRAYKGYFHSNDELLNRIWYAGAYTNQLGTIDPKHGNSLVHLQGVAGSDPPDTLTWYNNFTISKGSSCITDGAKRDRLVWPGDLSIALPSIFVSTNDLTSVKNAIDSLLVLQTPDGLLPYAGKPFSDLGTTSFTYHLYSLIGIAYYYRYSGDLAYLKSTWGQFKKGLQWSLNSIDESGLMDVTSSADWLRFGMGGHNIEANAILYYTINLGIELAQVLKDPSPIATWNHTATTLRAAANTLLYDPTTSLYTDNEFSTLHPQDGNVWAILSSLTPNPSINLAISTALSSRWTPYGAPAPEAGATISPFISGFEIAAHFLASSPQRALDLIRTQWGFMLTDPRMTNSTFIEGYDVNGNVKYAPYPNDARISHAHGWSTAPTSVLSFNVAGLAMEEAVGKTWVVKPQMGDLTHVEAGWETVLGGFWSEVQAEGGVVVGLRFGTPKGTHGRVVLEGVQGWVVNEKGKRLRLAGGRSGRLCGGVWTLLRDG